jgi:proline iminopeptidase
MGVSPARAPARRRCHRPEGKCPCVSTYGGSRPLVAAADGRLAPTAQQELGRYDGGGYSRPCNANGLLSVPCVAHVAAQVFELPGREQDGRAAIAGWGMSQADQGEEFVVQAAGAVIRGIRRGQGPPIVLLHGGPGCYDYFAGSTMANWLSATHMVYSYDQRGCRNSKSNGPFTIEANVDDLEAVRRWVGAEQLILLGHSAGAILAMFYAAAHPERVDRIILMSPAGLKPGWRKAFDAKIRERLTPAQRRQLADIDRRILRTADPAERAGLYRDRFNAALPCYLDPGHREAAPTLEFHHREVNVKTFASAQQSYDETFFRAQLSKSADRACIIHGRSDPIPWQAVDDLLTLLPTAHVVPLEHCGHFPWLEEPAACREALVAFLSR